MADIEKLTPAHLMERLKHLVQSERKIAAEVIEYIKEVSRRRLFVEYGHTSLFSFLTKELGYSAAAAQRRIDAARLLAEIPSIKADIQSGELNLMQVSLVAQSLRQKIKEEPSANISNQDKVNLLKSIRSQDLQGSQKTVAQCLNLEIKQYEKQKVQQDESCRLELTLSKEQMGQLKRVKELISHTHPNPSVAEVIELLATEFLRRKDPLQKNTKTSSTMEVKAANENENMTANTLLKREPIESDGIKNGYLLARNQNEGTDRNLKTLKSNSSSPIKQVAAPIRRLVFQRDQGCQWRHPNGKLCGSRFQLGQLKKRYLLCCIVVDVRFVGTPSSSRLGSNPFSTGPTSGGSQAIALGGWRQCSKQPAAALLVSQQTEVSI